MNGIILENSQGPVARNRKFCLILPLPGEHAEIYGSREGHSGARSSFGSGENVKHNLLWVWSHAVWKMEMGGSVARLAHIMLDLA